LHHLRPVAGVLDEMETDFRVSVLEESDRGAHRRHIPLSPHLFVAPKISAGPTPNLADDVVARLLLLEFRVPRRDPLVALDRERRLPRPPCALQLAALRRG